MEGTCIKILISTIGKRIERVPEILLKPRNDVEYIISWQKEESELNNVKHSELANNINPTIQLIRNRQDVILSVIHGRGLSANRNNAISVAKKTTKPNADSLWILADDDVRLKEGWLEELKQLAAANKDADLMVLQAQTVDGRPLHYYPALPFDYPRMPKGFYFNSMGMVLRANRQWPQFDTRFGLGAPVLNMGEEDIFVHDCYNNGLKIRYFPQPIIMTAAVTTSSAYSAEPALQMSKGAVLTLLYGRIMALPRIILTAIKMRKRLSPLPHLRNMLRGMRYILHTHQKA